MERTTSSEPIVVNDPRFLSTIAKHDAFWKREEAGYLHSVGVFAPSVPIHLPQPDGSMITHAEHLTSDMIDPASIIAEVEALDAEALDSTLASHGQYLVTSGLGDLLPMSKPLGKIPWVEAMLGCPIKMTEGHIWNEHYAGDPEEVVQRGVRFQNNPWFQLYLEFIRQLQHKLGGRFPVSANTLLRGPSDLAAAVMGVQEACIGWIDDPRFMARLMRVCTDALLTVIEAGYRTIQPVNGGYMSNWAIWAPSPVVWTQADHSTLVSSQMYEQQIMPYDAEVIRSLPMSVMHLHNSGLHIVPLLVDIPELTAIEVIIDPYPTPERKSFEIEMLQLIQQHKPLILDANFPSFAESENILAQCSRRGLCFNPRFEPEVFASLPADLPGSDSWLIEEG